MSFWQVLHRYCSIGKSWLVDRRWLAADVMLAHSQQSAARPNSLSLLLPFSLSAACWGRLPIDLPWIYCTALPESVIERRLLGDRVRALLAAVWERTMRDCRRRHYQSRPRLSQCSRSLSCAGASCLWIRCGHAQLTIERRDWWRYFAGQHRERERERER